MRALMLAALLLSACKTTWPEGATVTSPSRQRLCAKHRIPLVARSAWQAPTHGDRIWLVHDAIHPYYGVAEPYCPNHIPQHVAFARGDIFREKTTIYYCPVCEREFWQRQSVPDDKAAVKFITDLGPTWGRGAGHVTTGPYDVSLHKGVWTVRCRLDDGRPATIKIRKWDGALLDTVIPEHSSNKAMQPTAGRRNSFTFHD